MGQVRVEKEFRSQKMKDRRLFPMWRAHRLCLSVLIDHLHFVINGRCFLFFKLFDTFFDSRPSHADFYDTQA